MALDLQQRLLTSSDAKKKAIANHFGAGDSVNRQSRPYELSTTPVLPEFVDPNMCYMPNGYPSPTYYYGAYDRNEWNDYTKLLSDEGVDMQAGNYGYGYPPYGPYSPEASPASGIEGQIYGAQHYEYPTSYCQPMNANS